MPKVFIFCHGLSGHCNNLWFKQIRSALNEIGVKSVSETFPSPDDPRYPDWKASLDKLLEENFEGNELYIVTHSMGGYLVLRRLGETNDSERWLSSIKGCVLVAPPATKRPEYKPFYDAEINFQRIRQLSIPMTFLWSTDDERVKGEHIQLIQKELSGMNGFKYKEFTGLGHFSIKQSPEILEEVMNFAK